MKRFFDFVIAIIILVLLLPFFIIISIWIKLDSNGPLFFRQIRVGKDLKEFNILKFRSMTNEKRKVAPVIGNAEGVTFVGYFIRRYKVDELPQLLHVVRGEMSLVGPRPSIPQQLKNMNSEEIKRYSVHPGLTGLAQVSGNVHIPWKERYKFDLEYVKYRTFLLDIKILVKTFLIIVKGEEAFKGEKIKLKKK
jgi:undecaprenyl phosphate N,N'-diacetylbacillosamine 1-phosphate transferase